MLTSVHWVQDHGSSTCPPMCLHVSTLISPNNSSILSSAAADPFQLGICLFEVITSVLMSIFSSLPVM